MPWMHHGVFGREGLHGLTRERSPRLSELLEEPPAQDRKFQAWAVSFYNPLGAYTIGKVWPNKGLPKPAAGSFPQGTVVAKLLFAEATEEHLSHLKGAPSWHAMIHETPEECSVVPADNLVACDRVEGTVQLLQLDVAVKDDRAEDTNWVFGTFVFNGKLRPETAGAILSGIEDGRRGQRLESTRAGRPDVGQRARRNGAHRGRRAQHLGCNARLNGPVDNPAASCMACHALARFPAPEPDNFSMRFPPCGGVSRDQDGLPKAISAAYFRNLAGHEVIDDVTDVDVPEVDLLPKVRNLDRIRGARLLAAAVVRSDQLLQFLGKFRSGTGAGHRDLL